MRPVNFPGGPGANVDPWVVESLREIERASQENAFLIADAFKVANNTDLRTVDVSTVTLAGLANAFCTWISDMHKRGTKRAGG